MTAMPPDPSPSEWYYLIGQQRFGPVTLPNLIALVQTAGISPATLVWRDGMPAWVPAGAVPELAYAFTAHPQAAREDYLGLNTAGLVVFIVLLVMCVPLCWLPWVIDGLKAKR